MTGNFIGADFIILNQCLFLRSLIMISGWVRLRINPIIPKEYIQNSEATGIMTEVDLGDMGQHYLDPVQYLLDKDETGPVSC